MFTTILSLALAVPPQSTLPPRNPPPQCTLPVKVRVPPPPPIVKASSVPAKAVITIPAIQTTYRQPTGHTHTDAASHTWDHQSNPGHVCNALVVRNGQIVRCGLPQYVQDRSPRPVTVTRVVSVPQASTAVQAIPVQSPRVQSFDMLFGTGGCASGNCANIQR